MGKNAYFTDANPRFDLGTSAYSTEKLTPQTTMLQRPQHQSVRRSIYQKCAGSQYERKKF